MPEFHLLARRAVGLLALAAAPVMAQQTTLTVYTALEADQIKAYQAAFEREYPDIKIQWVRDSTGIITAKLLAEKNNPKADVIWGLAGTSLGLMDKEGMLEPYAPKGLDQISPQMRDAKPVPAWVGMDAFAAAICFNTVEAKKQNLPEPKSWQDLTRPEYAGKIVMPNPASSGTGFLDVSAWLQIFGEDKGWAFMDALHKNIGSYTHSGSKPCNLAASGEFPIGVSFDYRAAKLKADGAPVQPIFPSEGLGWEVEATAIVRGTKNADAARKVADFSASRAANELYKANFAVLAIPSVATSNPNLPTDLASRMIKNDFVWAATQRDRIIAEWTKRYDSKSEPKKK
ncbi:putative 2-aminoethylphosphonate ABC transporter substrate-binding protein [Bordetella hinzii]|uniref:2-aminoethylphosphonate ABC transporter substrate-binding protein n=2 Tax=Bordetella hinzii TaxID=103855 RepID=A0AAN1RY51_9BORD|nr:putative 2-aminoethylphosphonate ABC transporter substrate-binding protein [Bordetella hinzii]AKQ56530.1 Phosphoglycerate transport regulatory protein PgtC precursor [Bordetella hinzii]AKQ60988.1 Phosphoglycerate transport regulatory protein PgtC precursor [Bordetella hinzii]AZW18005.1 putative 2-aminoethylphosphonate ABC transporter substrate-binding protein [Bordetella hinzii]KCB25450.1 putative 2-aminoethylphosphonate ABC transporter, periplasmic 2-aminoethylphosphonate-binding protein [B